MQIRSKNILILERCKLFYNNGKRMKEMTEKTSLKKSTILTYIYIYIYILLTLHKEKVVSMDIM